jgi:hypothetical protein
MALSHKWDINNGFIFVLQFFSLIFDGLGGVKSDIKSCWSVEVLQSSENVKNPTVDRLPTGRIKFGVVNLLFTYRMVDNIKFNANLQGVRNLVCMF